MGMLVFLTILFLLLAQAVGLLAYYSKRNKYSKSAQTLATFLPGGVFIGVAVVGCALLALLKWWVEDEGWKAVARAALSRAAAVLGNGIGLCRDGRHRQRVPEHSAAICDSRFFIHPSISATAAVANDLLVWKRNRAAFTHTVEFSASVVYSDPRCCSQVFLKE
ncbi:MAG: hypothetical protein U0Y68_14560 [Blastocatellia bacterium]